MLQSENEVEKHLRDVPGWQVHGKGLQKTFTFDTYGDGIAFVNRVAEIADQMDHHPDLHVGYGKVTVFCTTHDAGGITLKDLDLTRRIEALHR